MKKGVLIVGGIVIVLALVVFFMVRSPTPVSQNEQGPSVEEVGNSGAVEPALASDNDVFNEFDNSLSGLE